MTRTKLKKIIEIIDISCFISVPWETSGPDPSENLSQAPHIHHQSSSRPRHI